jgi:hypothetical protein
VKKILTIMAVALAVAGLVLVSLPRSATTATTVKADPQVRCSWVTADKPLLALRCGNQATTIYSGKGFKGCAWKSEDAPTLKLRCRKVSDEVVLQSPNGKLWTVSVSDTGVLKTTIVP